MIKIMGNTHIGKIRTMNEDAYSCGIVDAQTAWALVCDGMGGEQGGEVASTTAVEVISDIVRRQLQPGMAPNTIRNLMQSAVITANAKVYELAKDNPDLKGMGTTVLLAVCTENGLYTAHAGDSRAYLIREHQIAAQTKDHTIVQMLVDKGELSSEEAKEHPKRHYITRALGVSDRLDVEYNEYAWNANSIALLCTDGLYGCIGEQQLLSLAEQSVQTETAAPLIDAANANGGKDNITAVLLYNMEDAR